MARFDLSDEEWAAIRPHLSEKGRGLQRKDDRIILNGPFYILRTGAPQRDLLGRYGPHQRRCTIGMRVPREGGHPWRRLLPRRAAQILPHPTHDRLLAADQIGGLTGIASALEEQRSSTSFDDLSFEERLGLLVYREAAMRDAKKLAARRKFAALRHDASVEVLNLRTPRGLDRSVMARLANGGWIARRENLLITGPTGLGKRRIACALGHKACRDGRPVLYQRAPRIFEALAVMGAMSASSKLSPAWRS